MDHVFGPVPSRRLGRSLGVDPIPFMTCNYVCIYCQLGRTTHMTNERKDFFPPEDILRDLAGALSVHGGEIDWITIVGNGEPTLYRSLGRLIRGAKELTDVPVAVITNGSLLDRADVVDDLRAADLVIPSLDAADPQTFRKINRSHRAIRVEQVVEGLVRFRAEYAGRLWLEIMLVRGVNDGEASLRALREAIDRIAPDRVFVNTPVRPPAEAGVGGPSEEALARARRTLGATEPSGSRPAAVKRGDSSTPDELLLQALRRHPMRKEELPEAFEAWSADDLSLAVDRLVAAGRLREIVHQGELFLAPGEGRFGSAR
jgi:wyosine [tRNA(Phe)-imidazoG37] synthetase (radical SAM superfamily)